MNAIDDDKLSKAASGLATEISPERDLWPGIEEAINKPKRSRWVPMLSQAAAVVLIVGVSSLLTYVVVTYDSPVVSQAAPANLVFERTAFGGEYTFASVYGRAGGDVVCDSDSMPPSVSASPSASAGSRTSLSASAASGSSEPSTYARRSSAIAPMSA